MPIIKCDYCGKEFERLQCIINKNKNNYCCLECYNKAKNTNKYIVEGDITKLIIEKRNKEKLIVLIDTKNLDKIQNFVWYALYTKSIDNYYAMSYSPINNVKNRILLHRLITNCPNNMQVDHINFSTMDNRESNLRLVTKKQNMENRKGALKNSTSGIRGVHWYKKDKLWEVGIGHNGKKIYGGRFKNIEEAEKAAIELRIKYFTHSPECNGVICQK